MWKWMQQNLNSAFCNNICYTSHTLLRKFTNTLKFVFEIFWSSFTFYHVKISHIYLRQEQRRCGPMVCQVPILHWVLTSYWHRQKNTGPWKAKNITLIMNIKKVNFNWPFLFKSFKYPRTDSKRTWTFIKKNLQSNQILKFNKVILFRIKLKNIQDILYK